MGQAYLNTTNLIAISKDIASTIHTPDSLKNTCVPDVSAKMTLLMTSIKDTSFVHVGIDCMYVPDTRLHLKATTFLATTP